MKKKLQDPYITIPGASSESIPNKMSILYVDDEPDLLVLGKLFLERTKNFIVDTSTFAQEALKSSLIPSYDAIVSDYQMPEMDGIAFLRAVREQYGDIPFILFTGRGREEVVIEAINNGADFYLQKGGEPKAQFAELSHKIKQAVRRKQAESAVFSSEARLRSFIETSSEAVSLIDEEGKVIEWNAGSEQITRIPKEDALGSYIWDLSVRMTPLKYRTEEGYKSIEQVWRRSLQTGIPVIQGPQVVEVLRPDGTGYYIRLNIFPIKTEKGFRFGSISQNVTEERRAEKNLRESEQRFRGMAERSSDLIIIFDKDLSVLYASPSARTIIGYEPEELTGISIEFAASKIFSQGVPELMNILQTLQEGESILNLEIKIRKKDGTPVFVSLYAVPIIHDGVFTGAQASLRVITDEITIKKALRASEERFRQLVENANEIVYILTNEGIFTYISPRVTELLGYQIHEVIGKQVSIYIHPDDFPRSNEFFINTITTGEKVGGIEYRIHHKNGTWRWFSVNYSPILNDEGNIVGIQGVCHDITERKIAVDALRVSEYNLKVNQQRLDDAMDLAHLANWEHDVENRIFIFNDRFYALYGTTAEQEGGYYMTPEQYTREFFHPEDVSLMAETNEKASTTTDPNFVIQSEHRIIRRDGEVRNILVRIGIMKDAEGRIIWVHGANQDITERKKIEEALRKANIQLNLLSSITRHDILNKVNVAHLYLDDAEMKCTIPEITVRLEKTKSAIEAIHSLIEFTRIYEELGSHDPQWIQLDAVMPNFFLPDSITLTADVQGISICADPMLKKVFFDLLDNSTRHGQRVSHIRVFAHEINGNLVVTWEDNGVGVIEEEKEKIFERGFGKNTGTGLFLIREILALTNISIIENGIPGEGARFELTVERGAFEKKVQ
ncbi:MAG TPA: PAS domain S-box protein [Methanospirillum sp.]|nr:PAS domain S-box protein [Methanospirillum sp.]